MELIQNSKPVANVAIKSDNKSVHLDGHKNDGTSDDDDSSNNIKAREIDVSNEFSMNIEPFETVDDLSNCSSTSQNIMEQEQTYPKRKKNKVIDKNTAINYIHELADKDYLQDSNTTKRRKLNEPLKDTSIIQVSSSSSDGVEQLLNDSPSDEKTSISRAKTSFLTQVHNKSANPMFILDLLNALTNKRLSAAEKKLLIATYGDKLQITDSTTNMPKLSSSLKNKIKLLQRSLSKRLPCKTTLEGLKISPRKMFMHNHSSFMYSKKRNLVKYYKKLNKYYSKVFDNCSVAFETDSNEKNNNNNTVDLTPQKMSCNKCSNNSVENTNEKKSIIHDVESICPYNLDLTDLKNCMDIISEYKGKTNVESEHCFQIQDALMANKKASIPDLTKDKNVELLDNFSDKHCIKDCSQNDTIINDKITNDEVTMEKNGNKDNEYINIFDFDLSEINQDDIKKLTVYENKIDGVVKNTSNSICTTKASSQSTDNDFVESLLENKVNEKDNLNYSCVSKTESKSKIKNEETMEEGNLNGFIKIDYDECVQNKNIYEAHDVLTMDKNAQINESKTEYNPINILKETLNDTEFQNTENNILEKDVQNETSVSIQAKINEFSFDEGGEKSDKSVDTALLLMPPILSPDTHAIFVKNNIVNHHTEGDLNLDNSNSIGDFERKYVPQEIRDNESNEFDIITVPQEDIYSNDNDFEYVSANETLPQCSLTCSEIEDIPLSNVLYHPGCIGDNFETPFMEEVSTEDMYGIGKNIIEGIIPNIDCNEDLRMILGDQIINEINDMVSGAQNSEVDLTEKPDIIDLTDDDTVVVYYLDDSPKENVLSIMFNVIKKTETYFEFLYSCSASEKLKNELKEAGVDTTTQDNANVDVLKLVQMYLKWFESGFNNADRVHDTLAVFILKSLVLYLDIDEMEVLTNSTKDVIEDNVNQALNFIYKSVSFSDVDKQSVVSCFKPVSRSGTKSNLAYGKSYSNYAKKHTDVDNNYDAYAGINYSKQSLAGHSYGYQTNHTETITDTYNVCLQSNSSKSYDTYKDFSGIEESMSAANGISYTNHTINDSYNRSGMANLIGGDQFDNNTAYEDISDVEQDSVNNTIFESQSASFTDGLLGLNDNDCSSLSYNDVETGHCGQFLQIGNGGDSSLDISQDTSTDKMLDVNLNFEHINIKTEVEDVPLVQVCQQLFSYASIYKNRNGDILDIPTDDCFPADDHFSNGFDNAGMLTH